MMIHIINGKVFEVKKTGNRFFYFSPMSGRWLPVSAKEVKFVADAGRA